MKNKRGFTLIEIMVATAIVALAVIPIFDMMSGANKTMASVEEESIAFGLCTEASEWMQSLSYRELLVIPSVAKGFLEFRNIEGGFESVEQPVKSLKIEDKPYAYEPAEQFSAYTRRIRVYRPNDKRPRGIRVVVEVHWKARLRQSQENKVSLELAKFELD
jgi:prepilin-type N-terminal cleavage/methylation domain-containing protein